MRIWQIRQIARPWWTTVGAGLVIMVAAFPAEADPMQGAAPAKRLADATTDTCLARCADTSAACKRVCPSTFGTPCQSTCDSQYQMCRQSCQSR